MFRERDGDGRTGKDMRDMQELATKSEPRDGGASARSMRTRSGVDVPAAAGDVQELGRLGAGSDGCAPCVGEYDAAAHAAAYQGY